MHDAYIAFCFQVAMTIDTTAEMHFLNRNTPYSLSAISLCTILTAAIHQDAVSHLRAWLATPITGTDWAEKRNHKARSGDFMVVILTLLHPVSPKTGTKFERTILYRLRHLISADIYIYGHACMSGYVVQGYPQKITGRTRCSNKFAKPS